MIIIPVEKQFKWKQAPYVLFAIVLINIAIFFFLQLNDPVKMVQTFELYQQKGLIDTEMPLYEDYLQLPDNADKLKAYHREYYDTSDNPFDELSDEELPEEYKQLQQQMQAQLREQYQDERKVKILTTMILQDTEFYGYVDTHPQLFASEQAHAKWQRQREPINRLIAANSTLRYALIPKDKTWYTFITHQFMHGGVMHLAGNMFFLIMCGFAVEAAIGHWRFLLFYLISGVVGGVVHVLIDPNSTTPLVGASGAISGVMAMYLGVFRLKKIEFFYWFYLIVGYIKAPAMLILLLYVGKELGSYLMNPDDNVAYMAHFGGFVAGIVLMGLVWVLTPHVLDTEYIEEDSHLDPEQVKQAVVMNSLEKLQFRQALKAVDDALASDDGKQSPYYVSNLLLKAKLMRLTDQPDTHAYVVKLLASLKGHDNTLAEQLTLWQQLPNPQAVPQDARLLIALKFSHLADISIAEQLFIGLVKERYQDDRMGILATRIAMHHDNKGNPQRAEKYLQAASHYQNGSRIGQPMQATQPTI